MISKTTNRFRKALDDLPAQVQRQSQEAYNLFRSDPHHPSLRFKKVHATEPIYSARINLDYRVVGMMDENEIIWFWIGTHAEYDKLLSQL